MATTLSNVDRWFILVTAMGGTFLAHLDNAAVGVALPHIIVSFGSTVQQAKWVTTAAMLTAAVTMPTTGWLGRRIGFGPLFILSLAIFVTGSAISASAWSLGSLVAARVFQSIGSGTIQPISMAIVIRAFPPSERGTAMGVWGAGIMLGSALGPAFGGFLTDWFGWRAIFAVNVPFGLLLLMAATVALRHDRVAEKLSFDWKGYLAFAVFIVSLLVTVDNGHEQGWNSMIIVAGLAVAIVSFLLFVVLEWDAPDPMMPFRLFRSRNFVLALILSHFRSLALFGPVFLVPLFLQRVQGRTALDTGFLIMPAALSMVVTMPLAGIFADRLGGRWPTVAGFAVSAISLFLFGWADPLTSSWEIAHIQILRGIGIAMIIAPLNMVAMNAVGRESAGYASWMINLAQRYGGAFAVAVLSLMLRRWRILQMDRMGTAPILHRAPRPDLVHQARALGHSRLNAVSAAQSVLRFHVVRAATTVAYQKLFLASAFFALIGVLPALLLSPRKSPAAVAPRYGHAPSGLNARP